MSDNAPRRLASAVAGLLLITAVAVMVSRSNYHTNDIELVSEEGHEQTADDKNSIQNLQRRVSKLMAQVRKAGIDAEKDASERDSLDMQLSEHANIANPVKAVEAQDELKEKISTEDHDVAAAETKRKSLQKDLDKAVNDLANAQLKAFDKKAAVRARIAAREAVLRKAKEQQNLATHKDVANSKGSQKSQSKDSGVDIASLERRVQALSGALEALKKLKASASASGPQGEAYLAELGQRLIMMPEVQNLLAQSLSANDLSIAEQIAKSLGRNFTASPPVDPKIMAEVIHFQRNKGTQSCNRAKHTSRHRSPSPPRKSRRDSRCSPTESRRRWLPLHPPQPRAEKSQTHNMLHSSVISLTPAHASSGSMRANARVPGEEHRIGILVPPMPQQKIRRAKGGRARDGAGIGDSRC